MRVFTGIYKGFTLIKLHKISDGSKRKLMEDVLTNKRPKRSEDVVEFPLTQATVFTDFNDVRRNLSGGWWAWGSER